MKMFWGLIMEPGKKYSQVVEKDFHIAQAALDLDSAQDSPVQVLISIDGRNYLVCTLIKNKTNQFNLDLNFRAGAKVSFATNGPGHVHLTGYLIEEDEFMMEEEESDDEDVEVEEKISKKRKAIQQKPENPNKKTKTAQLLEELDEDSYNSDEDSNVNITDLMESDSDEESVEEEEAVADEEDDSDDEESAEEEQEVEVKPKVSPPKKQKQQQQQESPKQNGVANKSPKVEKTPKGPKTPVVQEKQKTPKVKSPGEGTPVKKILEGGVIIEDIKVGDGNIAKVGRPVRVYYEGRLKSTSRVFDSVLKGKGFSFRLGKKEVIKGWDVGVVGMKTGGKRRITCPPSMAYGATGSLPVIPPNSTLIFEVELKQAQ